MIDKDNLADKIVQSKELAAAYKEQQDNIRRLGTLRTEIAREPDERERLRLCIQAIAVMTGDKVFLKTELKRLGKDESFV